MQLGMLIMMHFWYCRSIAGVRGFSKETIIAILSPENRDVNILRQIMKHLDIPGQAQQTTWNASLVYYEIVWEKILH